MQDCNAEDRDSTIVDNRFSSDSAGGDGGRGPSDGY